MRWRARFVESEVVECPGSIPDTTAGRSPAESVNQGIGFHSSYVICNV